MQYTKCKLKSSSLTYITWIPSNYAKLGKIVRIQGLKPLWEVIEIYESREINKNEVQET